MLWGPPFRSLLLSYVYFWYISRFWSCHSLDPPYSIVVSLPNRVLPVISLQPLLPRHSTQHIGPHFSYTLFRKPFSSSNPTPRDSPTRITLLTHPLRQQWPIAAAAHKHKELPFRATRDAKAMAAMDIGTVLQEPLVMPCVSALAAASGTAGS